MKNLLSLLIIFYSLSLVAQDTITVQTLTLESTTRNGVFEFPNDPDQSYRKVLMEYTMRCLDGVTNPGDNSTGCHEWDYSCNTFITDSTTVDSSLATHPTHLISNFNGEEFSYTTQPTYTHYQSVQKDVNYTSVISESISSIGMGEEHLAHPFSTASQNSKTQYLWTATELLNAGLVSGEINRIEMDLNLSSVDAEFLRIRIKQTEAEVLDPKNTETNGFTQVYYLNSTLDSGLNEFKFDTPFNWDGMSNVLVEFSFNNSFIATSSETNGEDTNFNSTLTSSKEDGYAIFSGAQYVEIPAEPMSSISKEITVMFWTKGDSEVLPANTYIFEGTDENGLRQANVHLPWSNGQIYWDCGNNGDGYDRINKTANDGDFKGKWSHWTFTKDANAGTMKIYLNGQIFHSGTGMTKGINIKDFIIGANKNRGANYFGGVNEFSVWNKALPTATINEWMLKDIDETHPNFENLVAYYKMDGLNPSQISDSSSYGMTGSITGALNRKKIKGKDIYRNFEALTSRPNISFAQGEYEIEVEEIIVTESELNPQNSVRYFSVDGSDLIEDQTIFVWEADMENTFDEAGNLVESTPIVVENSISIGSLDYFRKFPSKYELLSFVTPYGFGLNLGPQGKTWTFDVTDFLPILKGSKRLSMERGGQFNEEFDIKFQFIKGEPAREVLSIQNLWPFASGGYTAITEDNIFEERNLQLHEDAASYKVRTSVTGHGQNGEFIPRLHFLNIDGGDQEIIWEAWKECAENPVYPQGGTWIFDRAGWCPGMPSDLIESDITEYVSPGQSINIDYGVIGAADQSATNYLVSNQLVSYGPIKSLADAEILHIKRPSMDVRFQRQNPVCIDPIIDIKNLGSDNLTSLKIDYKIQGGETLTYDWTGNLAFNEIEEVILPTGNFGFWQSATTNIFEVEIRDPNNSTDGNMSNNRLTSEFRKADLYQMGIMTFSYKTNNRAFQNELRVKDQSGAMVFERAGMANNTLYNDDITLVPGCYTMELSDAGDDGLDFFYWDDIGVDVGSGYFQLQINGIPWKTFQPDFGDNIFYNFFIEGVVSDDEVLKNTAMSVYPNPNNGSFNLDLQGFEGEDLRIEISDLNGRLLNDFELEVRQDKLVHGIDLSEQGVGIYFVRVVHDGGSIVRKVNVIR